MIKHHIYFATNKTDTAKLMCDVLNDSVQGYNCNIVSKRYNSIYDFWDALDNLTLENQSNTLVIFDPGIYINIPGLVANSTGGTNYWHNLNCSELYPWYELVLRYPLITPMFLTNNGKLFNEFNAGEAGKFKQIDPFCHIDLTRNINQQLEKNARLFLNGLRTWFDPFGLRCTWRDKVLKGIFIDSTNGSDSQSHTSPKSEEIKPTTIFCVEDEIEYALLSGYAAYKYGAQAHIVDSYTVLEWAREKIMDENTSQIFIIWDRDLRFRDPLPEGTTRENLKEMGGLFPQSSAVDNLMVSSNPEGGVHKKVQKPLGCLGWLIKAYDDVLKSARNKIMAENEIHKGRNPVETARENSKKMDKISPGSSGSDNFRDTSDSKEGACKKVEKPLESMYKLIKACDGVLKEDNKLIKQQGYSKLENKTEKNHAAPYLNMQLAKSLLSTASKASHTYSDMVFDALLHMEAYVLLDKMAPTTSMQILKDLHLAEMRFELSFMGINKNQSIKDRKADVEKDIEQLLEQYPTKTELCKSFLISFWDDAKGLYKEHEQFNAAEQANTEAMKLIKW
jgi:hypothetical protein